MPPDHRICRCLGCQSDDWMLQDAYDLLTLFLKDRDSAMVKDAKELLELMIERRFEENVV